MGDSSIGDLVVRMLLSLTAVLVVIGVAYGVARRRLGRGGSMIGMTARGSKRRPAPQPIEVVGRAGLSRGSMAVALRFGDSVVLVGVSEQAGATVLHQIDAARWDELRATNDVRVPVSPASSPSSPSPSNDSIIAPRPTFLEALRDATTRRG